MKCCRVVIALVVLVSGCDRGLRSIVGPNTPPSETASSGFYTLSGTVKDDNGLAVPSAVIHLAAGSDLQTTSSGAEGEYRFDHVRGNVNLHVSKEGYLDETSFVYVAKNETLNVSLSVPLTLVPGTTLRSIVKAPPCDPMRWDAAALCKEITFMPAVTGLYELLLTWSGSSELDLLVDDELNLLWSNPSGQIRALVDGTAGVPRQIRIHSYYSPQAFELTATLQQATP